MDDILYITFKIEISDSQNSWNGKREEVEMQVVIPRSVFDSLDAGNLFQSMKQSALTKFDNPPAEK